MRSPNMRVQWVVSLGALIVTVTLSAAQTPSPARLLVLLRELHANAPRHAVLLTLAIVVAAVVAADLLRDDSGFVAAVLMGVVLGNQRRIDVSLTLEFEETLVQLLVGVLFVLIAASVSPDDVRAVLPETLVLVAVMVLLTIPLCLALRASVPEPAVS